MKKDNLMEQPNTGGSAQQQDMLDRTAPPMYGGQFGAVPPAQGSRPGAMPPVQGGQPLPAQPFGYMPPPRQQTPETQKMKAGFSFFGLGSLLYAVFYTFCMYRNSAGITYPFFVAGSVFFFCLCLKKLGISVKKGSIFYIMGILILGISTFLTADMRIIAMNKTGVFLLTLSFLLHQFYVDGNWSFGKYLAALICTVFGSLGQIARPFQDLAGWKNARGKGKKGITLYIIIGCCVAVPLFLMVWFLLITADRVFMKMTARFFEALNLFQVIGMVFMTVVMFFAVYCILAYLCGKHLDDGHKEAKRTEAALAVTVTLPLTIMYMIFSGIQVVCLFLGNVGLEGVTYAEYARQGFFQLLFICALNLILVLAGGRYFKESRLLKTVLAVMSLCTYVMILSAGMRMVLYIRHYYLTFLRILVLWALAVIFILLTGILISIFRPRFPLFRYGTVVLAVMYILLSFSRPDYWIAACNLGNAGENPVHEFFDADAYHDYRYLSRLSADAAPVVLPFLEKSGYDMTLMWNEEEQQYYYGNRQDASEWGYYYMRDLIQTASANGIRQFNVSKYIAGKMMEGYK